MKKFLLYLFLVIAALSAIFAYMLYTQGAFDSKPEPSEMKTFEMKCEAGKCAAGKCGSAK